MGHTHRAQDSAQLAQARLGSGVLVPGSAARSEPAFPKHHSMLAQCRPCRHWGHGWSHHWVNRASFVT